MERYFKEICEGISQIIKFPSYKTDAVFNMPFGKPTANALNYFLNLAQSLGFETKNYDNYIGEVVFYNHNRIYDKKQDLAILCHLDVVEEGNGWTHDPFGGEIENQTIFGRGALDDKGPAIICLYCLKALKEDGFIPQNTIRLIVGCNEESGWECIKHYNSVNALPENGFSPDADFPVIYAEKGITHVKLDFSLKNRLLTDIYGGSVYNMVCDKCVFSLPNIALYSDYKNANIEQLATDYNIKIDKETDKTIFTATGKSAHASTPEMGKNAIKTALQFLGKFDEEFKKVLDSLFETAFGLKDYKDYTGNLTFSPDIISYQDGKLSVIVDIRYPATYEFDKIESVLNNSCESVKILSHQKPLINDKNGKLVTTLLSIYNKTTNKNAKPIAIGGGTYARALKNGAGFGPCEIDEPSIIHQAEERITFDKIRFLMNIYFDAIKELSK